MTSDPWHEGERLLQSRAGVGRRMAEIGPRVLRDHMPDQHRSFFAQLPFIVAGSLDAERRPWASVLAAQPGFVRSRDAQHLRIDARPVTGDPLASALVPGAPLGLLGIEPQTRRRNRLNGVVGDVDARGFEVEVRQSFGNCPKYIQAREPCSPSARSLRGSGRAGRLDAAARRLVGAADTFFIAPHIRGRRGDLPQHGVDVSHRGGRPGFVRLGGDGTLTVPDFAGNAFFNTLGNIALNPMAGLLFIDFETGDLLQLSVHAEIVWDGPEVDAFPGAERLLRMQVVAAQHASAALPLRFGPSALSPHLEPTGRWG
ncbi:MAG: pyridoxamine 5'-phosphate oxidase family protein [Variovorax sp.]